MSKRIFFVAYGGAHIQMTLPVVAELQARGHECIIMALTTAQPVMQSRKLPYIGFRDLVEEGDEEALAYGHRLARDLPTPPLDVRETEAYLGLSYYSLEQRLGKEKAAVLYREKGRQCFEPISILERALKRYKPDLVAVTSAPRAEKAAVHAAKNLGIPSVCVFDYFGFYTAWASDSDYATRLLVFNERAREGFIAAGRAAETIVVTGNPAMDRLADPTWRDQGMQWRRKQEWDQQKVIFWASNPEPAPHEDLPARIDAAIVDTLSRHPDWRLIVRFHPSEPVRFTEAGPQVYYNPTSEPFTPFLYAADACLVMSSTVGLEAALVGCPLVSVDMSVNTQWTRFADLGISLGAQRLEEIEPLLEKALAKGRFVPSGLPRVGQAAYAVADVILDLLD